MQTIDDYLDAARTARDLKSDRELCKALGVSAPVVNHWRSKRSWPSDAAMVRLAELADKEPSTALLNLNYWRAEGAARSVYQDLLKIVAVLCLTATFSTNTYAEQINIKSTNTVYYGKLYTI